MNKIQVWSVGGMILTARRSEYRTSTKSLIRAGCGMNLGLRCKRPATSRLSRGEVGGKTQVVLVRVIKAYEGN